MPKRRQLLASLGVAMLLSIGLASIVTAHPRHGHPFRSFDNIRIDHRGLDVFVALSGDRDLVYGLGGGDAISSGDRHDHVFGGLGGDSIVAGDGPDWVSGGPGDDTIAGGPDSDDLHGGLGSDSIDAGEGRDLVSGGPGDDTITGGPHPDSLHAGRGDDTVFAADGAIDRVRCGPGVDSYTADPQDRIARDCENDITPP